MKKRFLFLALLISSYCFSQSVNDYKVILIPLKFDFLKSDNQYRLATLSKFNLSKAGFQAFYANEPMPKENNDRCNMIYFDVVKPNAFLITKLYITFKDCNGKIIFQSAIGASKEKDTQLAYYECLNEAFISVNALNYKYNNTVSSTSNSSLISDASPLPIVKETSEAIVKQEILKTEISSDDMSKILYSQPTANGFQLIDSAPKVIFKLYNSSRNDCFIAIKANIQGVLIEKNKQWFFEYYQNNTLVSEKVAVKF